MKQPYLISRTNQTTGRGKPAPITLAYPLLFLLITLFLGGLSACQRASQATFAPTSHTRFYQPLTTTKPIAENPAPAPVLTASTGDVVPELTPTRAWEVAAFPTRQQPITPGRLAPQPAQKQKKKAPAPPTCDQIVLRNGDIIEAKVKEVGVNEIKYKKCDRPDGPDYTISKRDVLSIRYPNGEVERFSAATQPTYNNNNSSSSSSRPSYNSPTSSQDEGPKTDPFAIVAIAAGGLAVLTGYGAFLLGAAAIVFGALSLSRIRKEPGRFKGKGLALAGMIAGLLSAAVILLYLLRY
jgi:hypothetical protein